MAWMTGFGAITLAASAIAALAVAVSVALIHESLRQRRIRRDLHAAMSAAQDEAEAGRRALAAVRQAVTLAGLYYLKLDATGTILDRNEAVEDLEQAEGIVLESFDLAAMAELQQKGKRLRRCRVERMIGGRRIDWALVPGKAGQGGSHGGVIDAIGRPLDAAPAQEAAKATFLATVSHEMRTPLNGVIGMAGLLKGSGLSAEQNSYVSAIETSGEALLSLINEILDYSRIEAGKLELITEPVAIEPLVEGVVELLAPRAQDKGIEIAAFVHPDVPAIMLSDGARLRQILMNLGANAVKFTVSGGVGVRVDAAGDTLTISVADTGQGIPADRLEAIFREFEQADQATGRTHGGTGLGLAISRRLVERLGGAISVISRVGAGSVFRVSLPITGAVGRSGDAASAEPDLAGQRMLLVSGSPFAVPFLGERLVRCGAKVDIAADAEEALRRLRDGDPARPDAVIVDAVIVDAGVGIETARHIAAAAATAGCARRLVMLSPYERRQVGTPMELGYTGYLVKPVRSRSLFARFAAEDGVAGAAPATSLPTVAQRLKGRRVLVAEDNDINALLVCRLIERMGGTCDIVGSGAAALEKLGKAAPGHYALALLDVRMPGMTGNEAVAQWRAEEWASRRRPLPVAALTANASAADRAECLAAGFDAFLAKPLDAAAFEAVIASLAIECGLAA